MKHLSQYFEECKIQNAELLQFSKKPSKNQQLLEFIRKGYFLLGGRKNMIFDQSLEVEEHFVKNVFWLILTKYRQSYNNLNVKGSCKLNDPWEMYRPFQDKNFYHICRTL